MAAKKLIKGDARAILILKNNRFSRRGATARSECPFTKISEASWYCTAVLRDRWGDRFSFADEVKRIAEFFHLGSGKRAEPFFIFREESLHFRHDCVRSRPQPAQSDK